MGSHASVNRFLKAMFNARPCVPRYQSNGQMEENSTLNWKSASTKISTKSYKCFTLKCVPKMDSFIILLRIIYYKQKIV